VKGTNSVFVNGFCGEFAGIIDALESQYGIDAYHVSDSQSCELNIFELFRRQVRPARPDTALRTELAPHFQTFVEMYSRHWYPMKISEGSYRDYFHLYIDFFSGLFADKGFSAAIFANAPHEGPDYVAYLIAKARKLKTLIFYQSIFENRTFISDGLDIFNEHIINGRAENDESRLQAAVQTAVDSIGRWAYMQDVAGRADLSYLTLLKNTRLHFKKNPFLLAKIAAEALAFLQEYKRFATVPTDLAATKYIYFPMHLQPELTTATLGGVYCDQLRALRELSQKLPPGYKILAKENPKQTAFKRPRGYYRSLTQIPHVELVATNVSTVDLTKYAAAVATISGTAGWEAVCLKKPVITFGVCWYRGFEGVFPFDTVDRLEPLLASTPARVPHEQAFARLLKSTLDCCVDPAYVAFQKRFDPNRNTTTINSFIHEFLGDPA
jgi:hypothetical protein